MTHETRLRALQKAENFAVLIGYDDYIVDDSDKLNAEHADVSPIDHMRCEKNEEKLKVFFPGNFKIWKNSLMSLCSCTSRHPTWATPSPKTDGPRNMKAFNWLLRPCRRLGSRARPWWMPFTRPAWIQSVRLLHCVCLCESWYFDIRPRFQLNTLPWILYPKNQFHLKNEYVLLEKWIRFTWKMAVGTAL